MSEPEQRVLLLREADSTYEDLVKGREVASVIDEAAVDELGGGFFKQTLEGAEYTGMIKGNEVLFVHEGELEVVSEDGTSVVAHKGDAILIVKDTTVTFRGKVGTRTFWVIHPAIY